MLPKIEQTVILAAGQGKRLGSLTRNRPKTMITVEGRFILEHTLLAMAPLTKEVIIVIGHLGSKVKKHFGSHFSDLKLTYIQQKSLNGTAGALWQARRNLKQQKFLVVNGDDLYSTEDLAKCLEEKLAVGLSRNLPLGRNYEVIELGQSGFIKDWHKVEPAEMNKKVLIISGAYVLDQRIFNYAPVAIANNELGLPQTILKMSKDRPVKGVVMDNWISINRPGDIAKAEANLK